MEDKEKIQNFGDMVNGVDKLTKPWRIALVLTNLFWAVVLFAFIAFAYLTPETTYQSQDFTGQSQMQSTGSEVVTDGN